MILFVQLWNRVADVWMDWILQSGLQSLLVLAVVAVLWWSIRKRASAHLGYALFLLPLIPLVLPSIWSVQLPIHSSSSLGQRLTLQDKQAVTVPPALGVADREEIQGRPLSGPVASTPEAILPEAVNETTATAAATETDPASMAMTADRSAKPDSSLHAGQSDLAGMNGGAITTAPATPSTEAWVFLLWSLTTTALLITFLRIQVRTRRQIQNASPLNRQDQQRVRKYQARFAPQRRIQVMECDGLAGPAAWGVRKPVVLFPPGMISNLDDDQLAWVLGHELAHHIRHDLIVGAAQRFIQMAWFFNPLVWWQARHLNHLRECACDESAQARTQVQGKSCAQALIEVVAQSPLQRTPAFALQNLHYDKKTMKLRILRLMNAKRPARAGLAPLALPLLLAVGSLCTTSFWLQEPGPVATPTSAPSTPGSSPHTAPLNSQAPGPTAPSAIGLAQSWLLDQQMEDGHWPSGPGFDAPAGEFNHVGVSALVLISLLDADPSIPGHKRDKAIQRGLAFLKKPLENPTTYFKDGPNFQDLASHAIATHVWLLAHRKATDDAWRSTAESAIKTLIQARNPYGAWGFEFEPNGDANTFNTTLAVRALVTAKEMGFQISRENFEGAENFLKYMTDKTTGRVGYSHGNDHDVRLIAKKKSHPIQFTELCTAMAILSFDAMGEDITESTEMTLGMSLLASKRPAWNPSNSSVDYYYWYFGTEAMKLVGGVFEKKWREGLAAALKTHQLGGEGLHGSFPAVDAWSDSKATVHATVMATLALQAVEQPNSQSR